MGCNEGEQPLLSKEGIAPAVMVRPSAPTPTAPTFPEYAAQAHAYPGVQRSKGSIMAVFEILKPAFEGPVDIRDNREETMAIITPGLVTDRIPEFRQTLTPGPAYAPFKMITQKVEAAANGRINDAGFGRVQSKASLGRPSLNHSQGDKSLGFRATQNDEVVGVSDHIDTVLGHQMVKRVQVDIGQQRTQHCALRCSSFRCPSGGRFHDLLLEKRLHQLQDTIVSYLVPDTGHEKIMGDRIKVRLQVGIYYIRVTLLEEQVHLSQCVLTTSARPKPVAVVCEVLFKDGLKNVAQRSLNYPVSDRSNCVGCQLICCVSRK